MGKRVKLTKAQRRVLRKLAVKPRPPEFLSFGELLALEWHNRGLVAIGFARAIQKRMSPSWLCWLISLKCHGWHTVFAITPAGRAALQSEGGE